MLVMTISCKALFALWLDFCVLFAGLLDWQRTLRWKGDPRSHSCCGAAFIVVGSTYFVLFGECVYVLLS